MSETKPARGALDFIPVALLAIALLAIFQESRLVPLTSAEPRSSARGTEFSGESAYRTLEELVTAFPHRVTGTAVYDGAAEWAAARMRALGLRVEIEPIQTPLTYYDLKDAATTPIKPLRVLSDQVAGRNVVGYLEGESDEWTVLVAHLDAVAEAPQGAWDDGSGVACLLELARVFTTKPLSSNVAFALCDREEPGMFGSAAFVAAHPELSRATVINLDTLGAKDDTLFIFGSPGTRVGATPFRAASIVKERAEAYGYYLIVDKPFNALPFPLEVFYDKAMRAGNVDATSFYGTDAVVASLTTFPWPVTDYQVHSPSDTIAAFTPESLGRAGNMALDVVRRLDAERTIERRIELDSLADYVSRESPSGEKRPLYVPGRVVREGAIAALVAAAFALAIALARWRRGFWDLTVWGASEWLGAALRLLAPPLVLLAASRAGALPIGGFIALGFALTPLVRLTVKRGIAETKPGMGHARTVVGLLATSANLILVAVMANGFLALLLAVPTLALWLPLRTLARRRLARVACDVIAYAWIAAIALAYFFQAYNAIGFDSVALTVSVACALSSSVAEIGYGLDEINATGSETFAEKNR